MSTFSQRLKLLRKKHKLTQIDFAEKLNVGKSTVAMWETADRHPDYETLNTIAEFFNVSTDYLLGRADQPSANSNQDKKTLAEIIKEGNLKYPDIQLPEDLTEEEIDFLDTALKSAVELLRANKLKR